MGFLEGLTLILLTLKLTGVIAISWFWVFSPLVIGYSAILVTFLLLPLTARVFFWLFEVLVEWWVDIRRDW